MTVIKKITTAIAFTTVLASSSTAFGGSLVRQWKQGLSGSQLASYSGSYVTNRSTLTTINFCRNGRYTYAREASWRVKGSAAGASNNRITGRWDVKQRGNQVYLTYVTDRGQRGSFPIYLQNNGRVNIGGAAYGVKRGGAGC